jgi:hypothetical protein
MSNEKLKELLTAVHDEMEGTDADAETRSMLKSLDEDIHKVLGDGDGDESPVMERAKRLEARFATTHPVAERIMREVIDTLVKLGF